MTLSSFGYASLRSDKIDDWADYGAKFLGLQLVERTKSALKFRMDDRKQRIVVSSEEAADNAFGWEVEDAAALDALAGRLETAKVPVTRVSPAMAGLRGVREAIRFQDPAGTNLEAFHGAEKADAPFAPGRPISGFRTGTLGMGHVVLHVKNVEDLRWFYQDVLGFRLSDYILRPFKAFFFHLNPRHHSLAMIETGRSGIHHIMMELYSLDDVGQAYDQASAGPGGAHRRDAGTAHQRFHDVVLCPHAQRFHDRVRLGRPLDRSGNVAAGGDELRAQPVGPRSPVVAAGPAGPIAGDARQGRGRRPARARAGDRRQFPGRRRLVRLVGWHAGRA